MISFGLPSWSCVLVIVRGVDACAVLSSLNFANQSRHGFTSAMSAHWRSSFYLYVLSSRISLDSPMNVFQCYLDIKLKYNERDSVHQPCLRHFILQRSHRRCHHLQVLLAYRQIYCARVHDLSGHACPVCRCSQYVETNVGPFAVYL